MISELEKNMMDSNYPYTKVKDYLFEQINSLPIGQIFTLRDLLPDNYKDRNLSQLGKEFFGLIQSGKWTGISIESENPNKYRKDNDVEKEHLFEQVNRF